MIHKLVSLLFMAVSLKSFAQTPLKVHKAGHCYSVGLPSYMQKTSGLNASASLQFICEEKDVAGFIIEDTKENLLLAKMPYASIYNFYGDFMDEFLKGEEKRTESAPTIKKIGTTNFMECEVSYFDKEAKIEIYYLVGIVETATAFYKILCWCSLDNKEANKADFQSIIYSLKE